MLLANTVTGLTYGNGVEIRAPQFGPPGVPDHTALLGNTTSRNGTGIENASPTSAFGGNVANDNRGLITSVAGATDLGGNRASGNNGGFVQCLGVVCR